jgi:hypothetical protein
MTPLSRIESPVSSLRREPYAAARTVSPKLHNYFAGKAARLSEVSGEIGAVPDTETIESMINAAFWASLRREEGYTPKISMAFLSPSQPADELIFERPLRLDPGILTRIAPAVERAGIHLGVWTDTEGGLSIWGAAGTIPKLCFVVEVAAPGLIVVKSRGGASGKFVNVAVLEGDQIKMINRQTSGVPKYPSLLTSLLGFESTVSWAEAPTTFVKLAVAMRAHRHGGSLLVIPSETDSWRDSIVPPMPYALSPSFSGMVQLNDSEPERTAAMIDAVAGLTAVDGAVVLTDRYEVLGFGAKIMRRKGHGRVEQVRILEPIEGGVDALTHPEQLGGTRHLSAAQFVHDQQDTAALVASQDGRFTIFEWSPKEGIVHAHRVETLLL